MQQLIASKMDDPDSRKDIYQDSLIRILTGLRQGRYQEAGKFTSWALRICNNTTIDYLRQRQHCPTVTTTDWDTPMTYSNVLHNNSLQEKIQREKQYIKLEYCISHLPDTQQRIINMHYYKKMTFREISEYTHENINTLLGRMRYALTGIRKMSELRCVE